jgi:pilus assembly protein Flp/PilA
MGLAMYDLKRIVSRFTGDRKGATAIEYGLIASLISVTIIGAVWTVGTEVSEDFSFIASTVKSANN